VLAFGEQAILSDAQSHSAARLMKDVADAIPYEAIEAAMLTERIE
jgi:hypothetical protein